MQGHRGTQAERGSAAPTSAAGMSHLGRPELHSADDAGTSRHADGPKNIEPEGHVGLPTAQALECPGVDEDTLEVLNRVLQRSTCGFVPDGPQGHDGKSMSSVLTARTLQELC